MSKIHIKTSQKYERNVYNYEGNALMVKNKLLYDDNGVKMVIELFEDKIIINRKNSDYEIRLILSEKEPSNCHYMYQNLEIDIPIRTVYLKISNHKIETKYLAEGEIHEYTIEY